MYWKGLRFGSTCPLWTDLLQKSPGDNACWRFWLCMDNTGWFGMSESKATGAKDLTRCQQRGIYEYLLLYPGDWTRGYRHQPVTCLYTWKGIWMTPKWLVGEERGTQHSTLLLPRILINRVSWNVTKVKGKHSNSATWATRKKTPTVSSNKIR